MWWELNTFGIPRIYSVPLCCCPVFCPSSSAPFLLFPWCLLCLSDERKKPPKFACRLQLSVSDTSQFKLYRETHWATPISFKIQWVSSTTCGKAVLENIKQKLSQDFQVLLLLIHDFCTLHVGSVQFWGRSETLAPKSTHGCPCLLHMPRLKAHISSRPYF